VVVVYLSIASYRDPLLQSTIDSAYATAKHPEKLEVGCFIQVLPSDLSVVNQIVSNDYNGRVKSEVILSGDVFSVTECRNRANKWLSKKHQYLLQIDSHSRFLPNWDETLIREQVELNNSKVLFSSSLPGWQPRKNDVDFMQPYNSGYASTVTFNDERAKKTFFNTYELVPSLVGTNRTVGDYIKSWYTCGHFVFGPVEYFLSIKQPNWILFWGEELFHSLMAFTHGWHVFVPPSLPIRHMFPQDVDESKLNKLWKDFPDRWNLEKNPSTDRVIDAIVNKRIGEGYLGNVRPLDELYEFLGYNLGEVVEGWRHEYRTTLH